MDVQEFTKEISKYPKEIILKTIFNNCLFDSKRLIRKVKWESIQYRFDSFMSRDKEIRAEMVTLINKNDHKSFSKYIELMNESTKINKKIDSIMKEMNRFNEYKE